MEQDNITLSESDMTTKKQEIIERTIAILRDEADLEDLRTISQVPEDMVVTEEQCLEELAHAMSQNDEAWVSNVLDLVIDASSKTVH